jgi:hypothetical protein
LALAVDSHNKARKMVAKQTSDTPATQEIPTDDNTESENSEEKMEARREKLMEGL